MFPHIFHVESEFCRQVRSVADKKIIGMIEIYEYKITLTGTIKTEAENFDEIKIDEIRIKDFEHYTIRNVQKSKKRS